MSAATAKPSAAKEPLCAVCGAPAGNLCSKCRGVYYCSVTCQKGAWKAHKAVCVMHPAEAKTTLPVLGGVMGEEEGRIFCFILDCIASIVSNSFFSEPYTRGKKYGPNDIGPELRGSQGGVSIIRNLMAHGYSFWSRYGLPPGEEDLGVVGDLKALCLANAHNPECKEVLGYVESGAVSYWGMLGVGRQYGEWWIMEQHDDGAILMSPEPDGAILRVLGIAQPLAAPVLATGARLPVKVRATVLLFKGRLVYDGVMVPAHKVGLVTPPASFVAALRRRLAAAVEAGKVQSSFIVPIEPALTLSEKQEEMLQAKSPLTPKEAALVRSLAAARSLTPEIAGKPLNLLKCVTWTLRRVGYSEKENPAHILSCVESSGRGTFIGSTSTAGLEPTSTETLELLLECVQKPIAGPAGRRPSAVMIDCSAALPRVRYLLKNFVSASMIVSFYAPPSPEDERITEEAVAESDGKQW